MAELSTYLGVHVAMIYSYQGQEIVNTFHLVAASGGAADVSDCAALAGEFDTWRINNLRALQSNQMSAVRIDVTNLSAVPPGTGVTSSRFPGTSVTGVLTGTALPGNVALCVTLRTAKTGRRYRGRSYQCGLTVPQLLSANLLLAGQVNAFVSAYVALVNQLATNTRFRLGVRSKVATIPVITAYPSGFMNTVEPVTIITADNMLDSQRRRLNGRGI